MHKSMKEAVLPKRTEAGWYYHPFEAAVCGFSGSGKTTLLTALLAYWKERGRTCAYLKHDAHFFEMDVEGKDTARATEAGAQTVGIQSAEKHAVLGSGRFGRFSLPSAVRDADVLLIEGNKRSDIPKVLLLDDRGEALAGLAAGQFSELVAVAGPAALIGAPELRPALESSGLESVPVLDRDDISGIAACFETDFERRVPPLTGLVLVGGRSTRMGTDKAGLLLDGRSLARRMANLLGPVCDQVFLSCRADQDLPLDAARIPRIFDSFAGLGPLGGILSAMQQHPGKAFFVLACDLPRVEPFDISTLVASRDPFRFATAYTGVLRGESFPEPLCTIYEPKFFGRGLEGIGVDVSCPRRLLSMSRVQTQAPLRDGALANANTPADWEASTGNLETGAGDRQTDAGSGIGAPADLRTSAVTQKPGAADHRMGAPEQKLGVGSGNGAADHRTGAGDRQTDAGSGAGPDQALSAAFSHSQSSTKAPSMPVYPAQVDELLAPAASQLAAHCTKRVEDVELANATGRVLAKDLLSDIDQPPFNRAAMDGIAVRGQDLEAGETEFQVKETAAAGGNPESLSWQKLVEDSPDGRPIAVEIMTGAAVPPGFDTVVRIEDLETVEAGKTKVLRLPKKIWSNVHRQGEDYSEGQVLLTAGTSITAGHLPLVASAGGRISVQGRPRLAILCTGSELVDPSRLPGPGQIRSSNLESLRGLCASWGIDPVHAARIHDDRSELAAVIGRFLESADVLVVCGGVSKGRFDYVPGILGELGAETLVQGMKQRPGKPLYVGRLSGSGSNGAGADSESPNIKWIFGLPGNPVSSFVNFRRYVLPFLVGSAAGPIRVSVDGLERVDHDLVRFPAARLESAPGGRPRALAIRGNGSGDFSQLAGSDGFVEVDPAADPNRRWHPFFAWEPGAKELVEHKSL